MKSFHPILRIYPTSTCGSSAPCHTTLRICPSKSGINIMSTSFQISSTTVLLSSNSTSLLIQFFRLSDESMAKILSGCPIVAPNIHCLRLFNSQLSYPLPDVASLTEAELEICFVSMDSQFEADFLQVWVLEMLEKLQNADKLNFGRNFVQILSIAEIRGAHFPLLKVKATTLDTKIFQCVIPGIERLLQ
ncbi:unnamed protein product, partial [Brassica oleracea]